MSRPKFEELQIKSIIHTVFELGTVGTHMARTNMKSPRDMTLLKLLAVTRL